MLSRGGRVLSLVAVAAAALAAAAAFSSMATAPRADASLALDVAPVPLDASDPSRAAVGPLRYLGGLWLRSADPRFGGLSDLRVSPDGARLFAVSDCGYGFTASLSYDAGGRLTGVADARLVELTGPAGGPLGMGETDAESLVLGDGLEVGFEGRARVQSYAADPPFGGPPRDRCRSRPGWAQCGRNGGLETMADAGDGRRLLVCEARRGASSTVPAWVGRGGEWTARDYPLAFDGGWAGEPFRPTGATRLPDGDLLLVERRFPPIGARIVRLARSSLEGTGPLDDARDRPLRAPAHARQLRGGGGAPRRLRPDAGLPALRRQRLREDARLEAVGPAAHAAAALRPRGLRSQPASAIAAISGSARRSRPRRFIFSCRVVGRTPSARAARRWLPLAARRASSITCRS